MIYLLLFSRGILLIFRLRFFIGLFSFKECPDWSIFFRTFLIGGKSLADSIWFFRRDFLAAEKPFCSFYRSIGEAVILVATTFTTTAVDVPLLLLLSYSY